jgi:hypothetical protein
MPLTRIAAQSDLSPRVRGEVKNAPSPPPERQSRAFRPAQIRLSQDMHFLLVHYGNSPRVFFMSRTRSTPLAIAEVRL